MDFVWAGAHRLDGLGPDNVQKPLGCWRPDLIRREFWPGVPGQRFRRGRGQPLQGHAESQGAKGLRHAGGAFGPFPAHLRQKIRKGGHLRADPIGQQMDFRIQGAGNLHPRNQHGAGILPRPCRQPLQGIVVGEGHIIKAQLKPLGFELGGREPAV